jgi:uncharacterized protein (TIGR02466 family)
MREKINIDNDIIKKYCLDLQSKDAGKFVTNYGGWQSSDIRGYNKELSELIEQISHKMNHVKSILGLKNNVNISLGNYWININGKGGFNIPHVHPFSLVSAVYYVNVPKDSGKLVFENPIQQHDYVMKPDTVETFNGINSGYWNVEPEQGELIIFPSWLRHWVEPNNTNENRISIAFNLQID